ncbi:MAG: hypothetical protein ABW252_22330 [Polyangiales bacterium]
MRTHSSSLVLAALLTLVGCATEEEARGAEGAERTAEAEALEQRQPPANIFGCRTPNIAIRTANGSYLVAENGGASIIAATRTQVGAWETFAVAEQAYGRISLMAVNSKYVAAERGGGAALVANRDAVGPWETFDLARNLVDDTWSFRANNGQWLAAENGGGGAVNANRNTIGTNEAFEVICR